MKRGEIQPDQVNLNNFQLMVIGLPPITFTSVGDLEQELKTMILPDGQAASAGISDPFEFDAEMPMHHVVELAAMEIWWIECNDPVMPTAYKPGTMIYKSASGNLQLILMLERLFLKKRKYPAGESRSEDMAKVTWTISCDNMLPPV